MGIEWLWRLLKEPWRFKRMMSLPKFALLVRREARRKRRQTAESVRQNVTKKEKK
jgi:N-acetylglucosaminyldiphosphoundecaprenol N-acetyl-beta-D-mannosaminyltransferase